MATTVPRMFGGAERFAPELGSWFAERVWLTLPKSPWIPKDGVADLGEFFDIRLDGGDFTAARDTSSDSEPTHSRTSGGPKAVREKASVAKSTRTIRGEVWGDGPPVYLIHGWGGYRGQLDAFVAPLVASGHRVVAIDAPGHGMSDPSAAGRGRGLLTEFADALNAVTARFGPAHAVIAHSLGSSSTALAVLDGLSAERLVFIAPMTDPNAFSHTFAQMLGFGERIRSGFLRRVERRVGRRMSEFDVPARASAAAVGSLPPLLIIHDRGDRDTPHSASAELAEIWPDSQLISTEGLGHYRILRDPETVAQTVEFISGTSARSERHNQSDGRQRLCAS